MKVLFSTFILVFLTCNSNQGNKVNIKKDCSIYNDKYVEYSSLNKSDSALYYINKAIKCDPKDDYFKTEKIRLLIKNNNYKSVISFAEELASKNDPNYKMLYGTLLLKNGDFQSEEILKEAYSLFKKSTKDYSVANSNLHFYQIALDNYFQGKEYSLNKIELYKKNYTDVHNKQLAEYIHNLILKKSKKDVLFVMFGIEN